MLLPICSLFIAVTALGQQNQAPSLWLRQNFLTPAEKIQLQTENDVDDRIRTYSVASARIHKSIEDSVVRQDFQKLSEDFECWSDLLESSFKDIEENVQRKKKSRALIRYEIQVRKSISDVTDLKLKAPAEEQKWFEVWLGRAERLRKKFVDILFQRSERE